MEQHPVPQNVTTFQFNLIGDMTPKQFGYLLVCGVIGYLVYLTLPLPQIINAVIGGAIGLFGFGLAFVPVEERPMDVWVFAFLKSVFSPTQYVWQRSAGAPEVLSSGPAKTNPPAPVQPQTPSVPASAASPPVKKGPPKGPGFLSSFLDFLIPRGKPKKETTPPPAPPAPAAKPPQAPPIPAAIPEPVRPVATPSITGTNMTLNEKSEADDKKLQENLEKKIDETEKKARSEYEEKMRSLETKLKDLEKNAAGREEQNARILELQKQLTEVLSERERMDAELRELRKAVKEGRKPQAATREAGTVENTARQPTIKVITPDAAVKAGLPRLTSVPNVVTGIIKDYQNNLLPGVLVTVKDREGMPVRALKTNKLGQFAASTPLPNNTYFIEVEDPKNQYVFDRIQITLTGAVAPAVEVAAKSQREIERKKLEQQIFGGQE